MAGATVSTSQARQAGSAERRPVAPLVLLPAPLGWLVGFYLVPLCLLLVYAFWSVDYLTIDRTLTFENFKTFFTNDLYPTVLVRTVTMAAVVTLTNIVIAFPLAWFIAKRVRRNRELLLILVIFPLWASYLVRIFAWRTILGTNGILN
jgi:putative spermidine/putrescine transport system permease protein